MDNNKKLEAGQVLDTGPLPLKVMAIAEGYVMARYGHCSPFAETFEAFEIRVKIAGKPKTNF